MILLPEPQRTLDQEPPGTAAGIIHFLTRFRAEDLRHQDTHFPWRVIFSGTLPGTFRKLPEQVLVCPANEIRFNIRESGPVFSQHTDQQFERVILDDPLPCCYRVEIHTIDRALEFWVLAGD
jgi:hypothetical protein